jgi:hypothetical protein
MMCVCVDSTFFIFIWTQKYSFEYFCQIAVSGKPKNIFPSPMTFQKWVGVIPNWGSFLDSPSSSQVANTVGSQGHQFETTCWVE